MRLDLTALLDGSVSTQEWDYAYMPDADGPQFGEEIRLTQPIGVHVAVGAHHGYLSVRADAHAAYETECARCLDTVSCALDVTVERLIETDAAAGNVEHDADYADSLLTMENGCVEIDHDITEELLLSLPMVHLCREDCPGLCPKCGKRLADGDCGCASQKEIDPRLAILQKLLEKNK